MLLTGFWLLTRYLTSLLREQVDTSQRAYTQQSALLDKAIALLGTKDPLSYQSVQYMQPVGYDADETYDPSEDGEISRIRARGNYFESEGELNASERAAAESIGDAFLSDF